jgi:hypothetical protein
MSFPPSRHRRSGETPRDHAVERRCRDQLAKCGLKLGRDRAAYRTPSRRGGYRIFNPSGDFVLGRHFGWTLSMVELFCDNYAATRMLPEAAMVELFERQARAVLVQELQASAAIAQAAVDRHHRRTDELRPDERTDARKV